MERGCPLPTTGGSGKVPSLEKIFVNFQLKMPCFNAFLLRKLLVARIGRLNRPTGWLAGVVVSVSDW